MIRTLSFNKLIVLQEHRDFIVSMFPETEKCFKKLEHLNKYFQNDIIKVEFTIGDIDKLSEKFEIRVYDDTVTIWN